MLVQDGKQDLLWSVLREQRGAKMAKTPVVLIFFPEAMAAHVELAIIL